MTTTDSPATAIANAPQVLETHLSTVFLTPTRAYKLLKPVRFAFVDVTDRAHRLAATDREIELNRRFSPDVYLGHADVVEDGEVVDRMIVMRRMPHDRRLSATTGAPDFADHLRAIARIVAGVHASAPPVRTAPMATAEAVWKNWSDNFDELEHHLGTIIPEEDHARARTLAQNYIEGRRDLFVQRIRDGFIRDGHGDLIADDIFCLEDGPRILDCLAFDDGLRIGDVLNDIGFLVMDVARLAGPAPAADLMRWYVEFTDEHHPASLAHHYVAYRAHVRAKIACIRAAAGDPDAPALARQYHDLTVDHLTRAQVRLVLVGGAPGTGKTTLAAALADRLGLVHLATDEIRDSVVTTDRRRTAEAGGVDDGDRPTELDRGRYDPALVDSTYAVQLEEARLLLRSGHGVVLDASWTRDEHRRAARMLASEARGSLAEIECDVAPDIADRRISRRPDDPTVRSDATTVVAAALRRRRDPWPSATVIATDVDERMVADHAVRLVMDRD